MSEASTTTRRVHRFEVRPAEVAGDPVGERVRRAAATLGVHPRAVRSARIYFIQADLSDSQLRHLGAGLLSDPVVERWSAGSSPAPGDARVVEVHPLPGVMDPAAQTVRDAVAE
ncbi:MAG: hypothetical protein KDA21_10565, partial [Phycisphaerales bacterium]|nr:hypothetical protein [Phycisphaerales bacterium]